MEGCAWARLWTGTFSCLPPRKLCTEALLPAAPLPKPLAVSCLAFTCHFNLVPVQCSLKDPSSSHMLRVLQLALAVCVLVYATVAVCGELWQQVSFIMPEAESAGHILAESGCKVAAVRFDCLPLQPSLCRPRCGARAVQATHCLGRKLMAMC